MDTLLGMDKSVFDWLYRDAILKLWFTYGRAILTIFSVLSVAPKAINAIIDSVWPFLEALCKGVSSDCNETEVHEHIDFTLIETC